MSQDAIDEMVEDAFEMADTNKDGKISLGEFQEWVCHNRFTLNFFGWFGTVVRESFHFVAACVEG